MKPVHFKEANALLCAPKGMEDCLELPIYSDGVACVSCWELTNDDLMKICEENMIWIKVYASPDNQPPIMPSAVKLIRHES